MFSSSSQSDLIPSMFVSTAIAMIFTQFAGYAAVFTVAVIADSLAALFFVVMSIFRPSDIFRVLCGVIAATPSPEIYSRMLEYIHGFVFGIPFFMMTHVVIPAVVIDGGKSLVGYSSLVLMVTDIAGDFLNAYVLGGGVYEMGFATSLSYIYTSVRRGYDSFYDSFHEEVFIFYIVA